MKLNPNKDKIIADNTKLITTSHFNSLSGYSYISLAFHIPLVADMEALMVSMSVSAVSLGPESVMRRPVYCSTVLARNTTSMGSCRFFPSRVKFRSERALSTRLVLLANTFVRANCSRIFVVSET